jgi:hypothetical protein
MMDPAVVYIAEVILAGLAATSVVAISILLLQGMWAILKPILTAARAVWNGFTVGAGSGETMPHISGTDGGTSTAWDHAGLTWTGYGSGMILSVPCRRTKWQSLLTGSSGAYTAV